MKKWEYLIASAYIGTAFEKLKKLGDEGWELVAVNIEESPAPGVHFFLKREKCVEVEMQMR